MAIEINVSDAERLSVLNAITELNGIQHITHMSVARIAETAHMNVNKCRLVVDTLMTEQCIERYAVTENVRVQRYYYLVLPAGKALQEKQVQ